MAGPPTAPQPVHILWTRAADGSLVARFYGAVAHVRRRRDLSWSFWIEFPDGSHAYGPGHLEDSEAMERACHELLRWRARQVQP